MRYVLGICLLFSLELSAQEKITDSPRIRSSRVERFDDMIILKLTQSSDVEKLAVHTGTNDIALSPNASTVTALSFSYQFLYVNASYVARFLPGNNDNAEKGRTRSGGISFSFNGKHWLNEFGYSRTKGYYLENTKDYNPSWTPGMPYVQFPQFVFTQYQGFTAYNFNTDFSVSALLFQTERQLKSAGSFIPQVRYRYYINDDRSAILPNRSTQKGQHVEVLAGAGYHYTLVWRKKFYASLGITPSGGYQYTHLTTRYIDTAVRGSQHNFMLRLEGRAGAGYNSNRFFAGFYVNSWAAAYRQQHSSVLTEDDRVAVQVFVGFRLQAPGWLKTTVSKVTQKAGL